MRDRVALALRLVLPAVWLGLIIAIDFIEAPLKFQAPGITIPLGLGIGRLVFTAMNAVEVVLAVVLAVALLRRPRPARAVLGAAGLVAALLLVKTAVIRPLLAAHTEAVLAGTSSGGSFAHYAYIAVDGVLFLGLIVLLVLQVRGLRIEPVVPAAEPDALGAAAATDTNVGGPR